jgi:ABC-type uncharacterized transport system ATPase subunit
MKSANGSSELNKSSNMDFSEDIRELTSTRDAFRQVENSVHRLSEASRREIECLVGELMTLHKKLLTDGDRIQLDIEQYAELNQHVMQLTTIIVDSVGKLPRPSIN